MFIATAVIATTLCAGANQGLQQPGGVPLTSTSEAQTQTARLESQQGTSGILIAADVEGRLAIYDRQQLVVELDKPAGRQLQVALDPGVYEAAADDRGPSSGLASNRRRPPAAARPVELQQPGRQPAPGHRRLPAGYPAPPHHSHGARSARHRIEVRFGGWGGGWYDHHDDWHYSDSAQGAFGLEYLNFVRNDLGVGIGDLLARQRPRGLGRVGQRRGPRARRPASPSSCAGIRSGA